MADLSQQRSGIFAAGNFIIDRVKIIEEFPEQDALVSIIDESDSNGGGPYNLLKDLALMEAPFPLSAAGLVGDDATGAAILAESHMVIGTWPEHGYAAVDIFTCGERIDPARAIPELRKHLRPGKEDVMEIDRGMPLSRASGEGA